MNELLYDSLPFKEEAREGRIILERDLIVVKMFSDSLLELFLRSRIADTESRGYLLELCLLLRLEGARVHSCCHRVRAVANEDDVVWDEGQLNMMSSININKSRRHDARDMLPTRTPCTTRGPFPGMR